MFRAKVGRQRRWNTQRRQGNIRTLQKTYNSLVTKVHTVAKNGGLPKGQILPKHIPDEGLVDLDVDNDIWIRPASFEIEAEAPNWHKDPDIRKGIRGMLQVDHCREERVQLVGEIVDLKCAVKRRWEGLQQAIKQAGGE